MKRKIIIIIFILIQMNIYAQRDGYNKSELFVVKKYFKSLDIPKFISEENKIIADINDSNINTRLILIDSIFSISDGVTSEACDTFIEVIKQKYLLQGLKYLTYREKSLFEEAFINYMVNTIKTSGNRNSAISGFDSSLKKIIPMLNKKETVYVTNLQKIILQSLEF